MCGFSLTSTYYNNLWSYPFNQTDHHVAWLQDKHAFKFTIFQYMWVDYNKKKHRWKITHLYSLTWADNADK
jgi:hypothetical protein